MTDANPVSRTPSLLFFLALVLGTAQNISFVHKYAQTLACYNLGIDTATYDQLAWQIVQTGQIVIPIDQPPGFILFLSGLYQMFGHHFLPPKIIFCLMISAIAIGIWWLGRRFIGAYEGLIAGGLILFSPMFQAYAATLQYEIFITFLFLLTCLLFLWGTQTTASRQSALLLTAAACCAALCALTREVFVVVFPLLLVWSWVNWQGKQQARVQILLVTAVLFSLSVGAWIAWQYHTHGQLVPISNKGPSNFYIGNNPNANGTFNLHWAPVEEPKGWTFIREQPGAAFSLVRKKFFYFWGFEKDGWSMPTAAELWLSRVFLNSLPLDLMQTIARSGVPLLSFIGMGLVLYRPVLRKKLWLFPATIGMLLSIHLVLISSHRFAFPVFPYIFLFAAVAFVWIVQRMARQAGQYTRIGLGFGCAWAIVVLCVNPPSHFQIEAEELEGSPLSVLSDLQANNGHARFHAQTGQRQLLGLLPQELLPAGFFVMHFSVRSEMQQPQDILEVILSTYDTGVVCHQRLHWPISGHGYQPLSVSCPSIPQQISRLEVWTLGTASVWLDSVTIELGLESAPPDHS